MQQRFTDQSRGLYDPATFSPELWTQFMSGQAPMMQGLIGSYLDQSKKLYLQMQDQMNQQTGSLFGNLTPPTAKKP